MPDTLAAQELWTEEALTERDLMVAAAWQDCVLQGGTPGLLDNDDPNAPWGPGIYVACASIGVFYPAPVIPALLAELLFPSQWAVVPPG